MPSTLPQEIAAAAQSAGLQVLSSVPAESFSGAPTTRFELGLPGTDKSMQLQLSDNFTGHAEQVRAFLAESARRLRSPRPDALLTLSGIPLTYTPFDWPFHSSTAGADTSVVHGLVRLADTRPEDGAESPLHAKIAAAMTITFREVVPAPEQPFAESFILNAVRKTFDQGQLELVKSGNRQPVPVTTRYYNAKSGKFVFNDTTDAQRKAFLAAKAFWLSGILGASEPLWLLDPRDAQYLNTSLDDLKKHAEVLSKEGLLTLDADGYATPTPTLLAREPEYRAQLAEALAFIKPTFNESMRSGQTNM